MNEYDSMQVGETNADGFTKGTTLDELPAEFQADIKKEYFERSPWMTIEALVNGKFRCHNIVTGCFIPAATWADAKAIRQTSADRCARIERAFR
jgi:hypothetical protein